MTGIEIPANAMESSASYFWLEDDTNILFIWNKPKGVHDHKDALENIAVTWAISKGVPRLLLIDMSEIRSMSRDAREEYANAGANGKVRAVALVTKSSASRILGNFFLNFNKPTVPTKLFGAADAAKKWLRSIS